MLEGVKHIFMVLSGKGGVGKSTVSTQLALALKVSGFKVGILDVDLCGPRFLLKNRNDSVVWRGPKKTGMIKEFLTDVAWNDIDYLIIDTPPGTSDEHITVMENLKGVKCDGAIIVTTPQAVAVDDVLKEECTNIFSSGGGVALSELVKVPFLAKLPIDPAIGKLADKGQSILISMPDSQVAQVLRKLVEELTKSKEA
ncbi:Similar to AAEL008143: Cytosolic Fe-S cluster assembly factor NUBP2 homolog (Aedes aegypti) [Cotesia congregata]|uniref:Similar to AAEL008143: Cytosolic Fe-S cluster assembly factor NUBP2 homolog (Aedes aegypti) n=1 Tax=Cotesia congregata TaxID=51543 RepID=A0A8J2MNY9_COTCN|nr:Similar to AAEL008143: Cytosolic Fe-S cluster assembly factor NUBP2 homolog (Aedes aegypti) [Cotesia congregata]